MRALHNKPQEVIVPELEALVATHKGVKKWSTTDEGVLDKYYGKVPTKELARILGRTPESVERKYHRLQRCK